MNNHSLRFKKVSSVMILILFLCFVGMKDAYSQVSSWDGSWESWANGNGSENDPFLIENAQQLAYLAYQVNNGIEANADHVVGTDKHFKLMIDIDLNGSESFQWIPIGSNNYSFGGHFDGNNHSIFGMYINSSANRVGFFGCTNGATVRDLELNGNKIATTGNYAGGIIGVADGSTVISGCGNSVYYISSSMEWYGNTFSGGIVGQAGDMVSIINCYSTGSIFSHSYTTSCSGGIVGQITDMASIINCYNAGGVSSFSVSSYSGGIAGLVQGEVNITNNYNTADISSLADRYSYSGGIVGKVAGSFEVYITNCYNTGDVESTYDSFYGGGSSWSGGVVGQVESSTISNSYNIGSISSTGGDADAGGIVGVLNNGSVVNSYYLDTCGGNNNYGGEPKTEVFMKSIEFVDILNNGSLTYIKDEQPYINQGYPILNQFYIQTLPASSVDNTSAVLNGNYVLGIQNIVSQGFEYKKNTDQYFTTINCTAGETPYSYSLSDLESGSTYQYRAFAITDDGIAYGNLIAFTTLVFYAVTVDANPLEGGSVSGGGTNETGSVCTLTATPAECYNFINWTEFGEVVSYSQTYEFNVTGDRNLVANFSQELDCEIAFADANVKAICVANWDSNGDGELSYSEAAIVTYLGRVFDNDSTITSFNELQYFTGLTSIGNSAFYNCTNLISITIPNSVVSIETYAFGYCNNMTSIVIPFSVTTIKNYAFYSCISLASIEIPSSVTSIGIYAFGYCSSLTSIEIPNSVISIGDMAFSYCDGLTSIDIPSSVTSIGTNPFSDCSGLAQIIIDPGNTVYDSRENCNAIIKTSFNQLVAGCKNTIIPNTATSIGTMAFCGCTGLTSIVIPNSVRIMGSNPFEKCIGLEQIIVDSGNMVFDSRESCNAIIETSANRLVSGCKNTVIPNSVTSLGAHAFHGCSNLTYISIPNSVTTIEYSAFCDCTGLTSINIPITVTSIESWAFGNCTGLTTMTVLAENPPALSNLAFFDVPQNIPIYVPCASLFAYQVATRWNEFNNYIPVATCESGEISVTANPIEGGSVTGAGYYEGGSSCTLTATANPGYSFINWTKNGNEVSTSETISFIVGGDASFVANFERGLIVHNNKVTNGYVPIYGHYADAYLKSQAVYPASELSVMNGTDILKMSFYTSQSNVSWGAANFQVFMAEVAYSTINTFTSPGTIVYEGTLGIVDGVMEVVFSNPYHYNGGNLLVSFYNTVRGSYVASTWYGESVTGSSVQGYSFTSLGAIAATQRNFLPKTLFLYDVGMVPETNLSAEICQGDDYLQNGFEIFQPEVGENVYSITLPSSQGLDSIVNLTLTVYPSYNYIEDTTLCGMSSFQWLGNTYTESGLYYDSLQSVHGCDSIFQLNLEFFSTPLGEFTYMTPTNNYPFSSLPITFSWDAVSGAENYDLYVWDADDPMPNDPFVSNLTGRNYSTIALLNYHTYNWFVTARNACYETSSNVKSFHLDIMPSLNVNLNQIDFGEVTFNQSVSTTVSVSGVVLEDSLNVQITGDDAAMFSFTKASGWNDYTGGILIVTFYPTVPQYSYNANIVIGSGALTATTSLTGGLADMYVFNTYVVEDVYAMNSPIPIYGSLTDVNSIPVVNEEVEIGVFVMGMKRTLQAVTDESGQFSAVFEPMPSESGYYTVNSGRVGNHSSAVHDDFNIPGMTLVSSDYILCAVTQDQPKTDSILIRNKSNLSLNNIQMSPITVPDGASFSFMPLSLSGLEENWLVYTVIGSTLTQGNYYEEAKLKATSSEGAEMNLSIWYYCMEPRGVLDVMPKSLATTMTKGKSKIVDVMLTNNGTAATGNITIDLPDVEWMSVVGNDTLSSIAVNDTAYFSLRFSPAEDIQLGQYSGTIAINSERGDAVALPYTITAVSDSTGTLMIDVTDDFTWNTNNGNGPHLEGAEVTLKGYYSLETVAYGFTDADGHFSVEDLPEGYYRLSVTAERHTDYNSVVFVEAGATGRSYTDVYLQYQAVTYSWTVEPTEILDEYNYELNVVFETNVPVPVVVIEAPDKLPAFDESYTFNYVVTNHGLINAENLKLHVPISNDFLFTPLFEQVDTLHALTTIVVPCVVTYKDNGAKPFRGDCAEWGYTWTEYTYKCLKIDGTLEVNTKSGFVYTLLGNKPCEPPTEIEGNGGNGFNAPLLGIVGGHGFPNPFFTSPLLEMWYECDNGCVNMVFWGIDKLLSNIPVAKWIYTGAKVVYNVATIMDQDVKDALISVYDFYKYVANMANAMSKDVPPMVKYMKMAKEVKTVKQNIIHCYHYLNGTATKDYELELDYSEVPNEIGEMLQYMDEYASAATNMVDILNMYYSDTTWFYSDINELDDFMNMVFEYDSIYGRVYVDSILLSHKPSNINNDQVTSFVDRYNNTVDIYNGVVINSDNYIPIDSINSKLLSIINIEHEALLLGFESSEERIMHLINEAYDYLEENKSLSVCAKVTVQFSQKMTMTREAFDGTLTIHNGHDTDPMEAIDVNFIIKDEEGNNCTNLFQINTMSLNNITGIDGSGSLGAGLDGIAKIQFIPTKYAAPTEPKVYYFGGTFSFIDPYTLDEIVYDLYPVEITVNPSPDLYVDYFMQRDILGDDALTLDVVEPSVPAELGVIINNKGAGMAKNVLLETAEPQIIDNEKGLAIDFAMYGASFNGSPRQLGLMEIPFGNIESGQTAVGEWLFTSSLLGHFVSYTAHVIHNSSYGNPNLSLVSHLDIHELIHPIYAYGNLDDGINDFLVNDNPDAYDTPDSIYFSHGGRTTVGIVETISFNHYVEPQDTIVILTINPSRIGWNYGVTDDPGRDKYELVSCTRNFDNQIIPLSNVWQSFVTIPDGGDPVYENKLHIVDTLSNDVPDFTYTLVYQMKNDLLAVEEILGIPESYIEYPLESINVKFSKPIIDSTFSYEDMTLKCNNGANLMDSTVVVAKISDSLYSVNISNVTNETGLYVLTVNTSNIKDTKGYDGYLGKQASWVQLLNTGVMQTIPLSMGWNWFSSYLTYNDYSLLIFEEQISEVGATGLIKSQNSFTTGNASGFWAGSLNVLDNTQMYMILVDQNLTLTISGAPLDPSAHPITLRPGWNWIAYLSDNGMSLTEATANYSPAHFDIIKSQNQFSTYYEGLGWLGSLNALEPGEGYMYMSNQAEVTSFIYPTPNKEFLGITPIKTFWNTDSHRFQGNMTMMVTLDADQFIMGDGSHEIGAFVNGDCRGSARLQYVDGLNRYVAFLTVGGLEGEEVTFRVYGVEPASAIDGVAEERVTFMANNVIGTLDNPLTLHFGQTGLTEDDGLSQGNRVKIFPNPTNDKVTVLGDGIRSIKISNALGQVVLHKEYGLIKQVELSMSQVGVGVYTLIVNTAYGTHTTKLVVTE